MKALRLTPVQCQTLAWIRERQLKKMVVLAGARRELNMRVRSHATPTCRLHANMRCPSNPDRPARHLLRMRLSR